MSKHIASVEEFDEAINSGKKVLVDFNATWCAPCKMLSPIIDKFADEHPDVTVLKVDTDEFPGLAKRYDVYSIPNLCLFEGGKLSKQQPGFMPEPALKSFVGE